MRTEEQVLQEFVELGYRYNYMGEIILLNRVPTNQWRKTIAISKNDKLYCKYDVFGEAEYLSLKEHKLIHELIEIWGWIE